MKSTVTIGRSSSCDIIVPNESVSREHARVSIVGGDYVYEDVGKNGSVIGGRVVRGERIAVAPGTEILLAGKVPLPWTQVYQLLPLHGSRPFEGSTSIQPTPAYPAYLQPADRGDSLEIWIGILSFLVPIVGLILYFSWKKEHPNKARQALTAAGVGFTLNAVLTIAMMS